MIPLTQPDLVVGPTLTSQARVLAVAHDHPLAGRESVDVEELADHHVFRFEDWPQELRDAMVPSRTPGGRPVPYTQVAAADRGMIDLSVRIARGEIVHPTVASAPAYMGDLELVFVPITGMPPLRSALVWSRRAREPKLRAFVAVARGVLSG